ncbi:MAG: ATP-binding protein [Candidatus Lokiarchaeota archaeon]|nr:ATP-binding protein [Candidatus Lokiarchaeota archaeon]
MNSIIYWFYKKRGYSLTIYTICLISNFTFSLGFFIYDLFFFIQTSPIDILIIFNDIIGFIFIFNISVIWLGISIIIFILSLLKSSKFILNLESPSYIEAKEGNIKLGRVIKEKGLKYFYHLSLKDLAKHIFVCGSTGTGKSNFLQYFLINFKNLFKIPFFLVEFKGEYHFMQKMIDDLIVLWPGENFSINIFDPDGVDPLIHSERIFDIFKSGKFLDENSEYSPQMEKVLIEILAKTCADKKYQSWPGFDKCCKIYLDDNQKSIPMLKQTLISVNNRIRRFSQGPLKALFEPNDKITLDNLFKMNVILDLSSIIRLGGEKEDALFFLNMVLKYLWDKNLANGAHNYEGIKHLTIIEDAQYFAPQGLIKKTKITSYLEDIALLQRGTGECLITLATRPDISKEILANNGVVLTFKNHIEKEIMCELLNLDLEKKNYLSALEEGHCIIRVNSLKNPFILHIPLIKRETLTVFEIKKKNEQVIRKMKRSFLLSENQDHKVKEGNINKFRNDHVKLRSVTDILQKLMKKNKNEIIKKSRFFSKCYEIGKIADLKDSITLEGFKELIIKLYESEEKNKFLDIRDLSHNNDDYNRDNWKTKCG